MHPLCTLSTSSLYSRCTLHRRVPALYLAAPLGINTVPSLPGSIYLLCTLSTPPYTIVAPPCTCAPLMRTLPHLPASSVHILSLLSLCNSQHLAVPSAAFVACFLLVPPHAMQPPPHTIHPRNKTDAHIARGIWLHSIVLSLGLLARRLMYIVHNHNPYCITTVTGAGSEAHGLLWVTPQSSYTPSPPAVPSAWAR